MDQVLPVIVDRDGKYEDGNYETRNWVIELLRIPAMVVLNLLPARLSKAIFLAVSGPEGKKVADSVGTFRAMETIYAFPWQRVKGGANIASRLCDTFLINTKAVRNRLRLVKRELTDAIQTLLRQKVTVNVLSVGSGSARSVFEVLVLLNGEVPFNEGPAVNVMLVDIDEEALRFSEKLAEILNVNSAIFVKGNFFRLERHCGEFRPDIVEAVGLLDYLTEKQAVILLKKIWQILAFGGSVITANIAPNLEAPFVTKGIGWPMVYRTPLQLVDLLVKAGFPAEAIRIKQEPLGIHTMAIAQKLIGP